MNALYRIEDTREIITPALLVFHEILQQNLAQMIRIAGSPARLRPHCKTHKMGAVTAMELQLGISKHKCATLAEAEMLALAGAPDIFLAYNLVGKNIDRAVRFREKYPAVKLSVTGDHPAPLAALGTAMSAAGRNIDVLLDIDTGMHRTGLPPGPAARKIYQTIVETPGLNPGGIHLYDGQNQQASLVERTGAVDAAWNKVRQFRDSLRSHGWPVPRIVAGGTGSFPIFARYDDATLELSPGTVVFHDGGYSQMFPDLDFQPAALLLTRVISRPTKDRVTLDLGYKAVASDPPVASRLSFPELEDARIVLQNEEHLVLETARAEEFQPGDELLAIPRHICPTSALHQEAWIISHGRVSQRWPVTARDRRLTI